MNKEWKNEKKVTLQAGGLLLIRHEWRLRTYYPPARRSVPPRRVKNKAIAL